MKSPALLLCCSLLLLAPFACDSSGEGGAGEVTDRTTYPPGPYGLAEGDVLADLSFTNADGTAFSFGDVFANSKHRVLLVTTTAGWCTACIEEQPKLKALHGELKGNGLQIVAAMFEDADFAPATVAQIADWDERYDLPYPLVLDEGFKLGAYYDPTLTPMNMIVDVDTMEILKITTGFDEAVVRAVIEANLDL